MSKPYRSQYLGRFTDEPSQPIQIHTSSGYSDFTYSGFLCKRRSEHTLDIQIGALALLTDIDSIAEKIETNHGRIRLLYAYQVTWSQMVRDIVHVIEQLKDGT